MGLFDLFKKKQPEKKEVKRELNNREIKQIIDYLHTSMKEVLNIKPVQTDSYSIFESRFGGYPYWTKEMSYPCTQDGKPLFLLAQINCTDLKNNLLPSEGILQFFIASDHVYGLNFEDATKQDTFRIIYHPIIDKSITVESVKQLNIQANTDLDKYDDAFPFYKAYTLSFESGIDTINHLVLTDFQNRIKEAFLILFNENIEGPIYQYLSDESYQKLVEANDGWGHKMLGYPAFTQEDPRDTTTYYDTLLLQIDSDCQDILWGDSGICNFFINSKKLKNKDFSDVLYNWDCY